MKKIFNNKGQSMVEFTLILPVFLILLLGMFDTSRILSTKIVLQNTARNAARVAAVTNSDSSTISEINNGTTSLDSNKLNYTITPLESYRNKGENVTINIDYTIDINTPIISNIFGDNIVVEGKSVMRVE
ncbi:pilus assembly protein [Clostridiaceae bacterium HSG29]|nr:pilus assembly protein [Clostridiaceae bacterium HSG29]